MKTITKQLVNFAIATIILTLIFRFYLSYGIESKASIIIGLSAIIYGLLMFVSGWYFGKKDCEYLPIFDVGFRFHLTTYLIHNGISLLWLTLGFGSKYESTTGIIRTAIIWGVFLTIHFFFFLWAKRNSIDNLKKKDLFE